MIIEQTYKIILGVVAFMILIYIFIFKVPEFMKSRYCNEIFSSQGVILKGCEQYISFVKSVDLNGTKEKVIEDLAGLLVNCYYKYLNTNYKRKICFEVSIKNESISIKKNELLDFIGKHTPLKDKVKILTQEIVPFQTIIIYFNNSKVVLWQ